MKKIIALILSCLCVLARAQGQGGDPPGTSKTMNCPTNCPATCWFLIDLVFPPGKDSCNNTGYSTVDLNMFYGTSDANSKCKADIDRESQIGSGNITYVLCNGDTCKLTAANFPDGQFRPYPPGTPNLPPGKKALSPACYNALKPGGTVGYAKYTFKGIKDISASFKMIVYCDCEDDTIQHGDTLPFYQNFLSAEVPIDENGDGVIDDKDKRPRQNKAGLKEAATIYDATSVISIRSIYPNPSAGRFNIQVELEQEQQIQLTLVDATGKVLSRQRHVIPKGNTHLPLEIDPTIKSGYYYLIIHQADGKFSTTKLLIQQ